MSPLWLPDRRDPVLPSGVGGVVNRLLPRRISNEMMIPFRVKGPISDPGEPQVDPVLFLTRFGSNLINAPGRMLEALSRPKPAKKK